MMVTEYSRCPYCGRLFYAAVEEDLILTDGNRGEEVKRIQEEAKLIVAEELTRHILLVHQSLN